MQRILKKSQDRCFSYVRNFMKKPSSLLNTEKSKIHNIGIVAHVDAGKTTLTERFLYLSGTTTMVGDVDCGNTITDFLDIERERGITVQSAAVTFPWSGNRINLIDTPGHVDFTVEVERCLRVLDGVVTVIDSSAGVQAQTLTVWRQSKEFNIPSIFFLNKMDKPNSDYEMAINSIENKLDINVVPLTIKIGEGKKCVGILDLMNGKILETFDSNKWIEIDKDKHKNYYDLYLNERENMVSKIVENNNDLSDSLLKNGVEFIEKDILKSELRVQTLQKKLYPLGVGSALNSTMSVFPILDMIVDYLPTPCERNLLSKKIFNDKMSGLVFKIGHDDKLGQLFYTRIYTGTLKNNSILYNGNRQEYENKVKIYIPYSDEFVSAPTISEGNIAVITGLKETRTGESLFEDVKCFKDGLKNLRNEYDNDAIPDIEKTFILENENGVVYLGINPPDPVFYCSIEPPSQQLMTKFERALEEICKEDPSVKISYDKNSGETILEAMGVLHIEIIKDRLKRHYGLDVFLGKLQVSYREVVTCEVEDSAFVETTFGDGNKKQHCEIGMKIVPKKNCGKFKNVDVKLPTEYQNNMFPNSIRPDWYKAINAGCKNALYNGPLLGFPVEDVEITVTHFKTSGNKINISLVSAAANECVKKCLINSEVKLTEPYVKLNICVYDDAAESSISGVLHELNKRRAEILDVKGESTSNKHKTINITALMPLIETTDLSKAVRSAASGMITFNFTIEGYQYVSEAETNRLVSKR
ncbi:Ribosome-releasing factor 2, mitochondrial [Strongyloides ratti]|uniref:Ribosome-releasing factor 2, mitochondrial n=1 Tax=Strongyloides ratti TaxID=34506 RepID=A0A090KX49_STRRB|nr:Ribosome-releasing factor 2, mitochondrial [Strongyloides ratti]CEF61996.1 Ribosome-releasing factor 2, mitochondrial [Strongyloides ratti]